MAAVNVINLEAPQPKGNWVARNLRLHNDKSKELFPQTPLDVKPTKFHSMYKKDYHEFPTDVVLEGLKQKGQQPERETIRDVLFGKSPTSVTDPRPHRHAVPPAKACLLPPDPRELQLFSNWRIPKRISGEVEDAKIGDHIGVAAPPKVETPRILRQQTLPAISSSREPLPTRFTPKPRLSASDAMGRQPGLTRRAKTSLDMPSSRMQASRDSFKTRVGKWQQRLPDVDQALLEKVLRIQDRENAGSQGGVKGTLLPDARRTVERWLGSASESERQVAVSFFNSLVGGRLMGANGIDQTERLKDVIATLQSPAERNVSEMGLSPRGGTFARDDGRQGLQYVRLLDGDTRKKRWMHTTWHHLPNYQNADPVENSSSHYIRPHQPQHRHFVIHPDWPPQH